MSSGNTAQGMKALIASAAGTRIALFLSDRPDHRQLTLGTYPGDLFGVERQIIAQHTGRLLGGHLGQDGDVIENGRDIVE
jgi:hypothetical protein